MTNVVEVMNKRFRDAESNQEPESKPSPFVEEYDDDNAETAASRCRVRAAKCFDKADDDEAVGDFGRVAGHYAEACDLVKQEIALSPAEAPALAKLLGTCHKNCGLAAARSLGRRLAGATLGHVLGSLKEALALGCAADGCALAYGAALL